MFIKEISICKGKSSSVYQEEEDDSKISYQWRRENLNLQNNHTLVYCVLPGHLPQLLPTPNIFLCLKLEMVFKVMAWVILGCYSVSPGLSYVYRRYPCYQIYVCFSLVNVFYYSGRLYQEPRKTEGKLVFLPYIYMPKQYFVYVFLFLSFPECCLIQVSAHYSPRAS